MTEAQKDTQRAIAACKAIADGRDIREDSSAVLVTLDHVVATMLLAIHGDPNIAAKMLNEGLLQGVEERIALFASKQG